MLLVLRLFRNDEFRQADRFCDTAVELWPNIPELKLRIFLLWNSMSYPPVLRACLRGEETRGPLGEAFGEDLPLLDLL